MDTKMLWKMNPLQVQYYYEVYGVVLRNVEKLVLCSIQVVLSCLHQTLSFLRNVVMYFDGLPRHSTPACHIMNNAKKIKKCPKHIVILLNEDQIVFEDVANLIVWSVFSGISHVTICDKRGSLVENSAVLQEKYEARLNEICDGERVVYPSTHFHRHKFSDSDFPVANHVILSSMQSSRRNLLDCVKFLSSPLAEDGKMKQELNANYFDKRLKELDGCILNPDLALVFGPYLSYFGYQPWNVRLTEFISLSSHQKLSYKRFHRVLLTFARCEQRFGT